MKRTFLRGTISLDNLHLFARSGFQSCINCQLNDFEFSTEQSTTWSSKARLASIRRRRAQSESPLRCAYHEPIGSLCQINSTVWTFPFTSVGGVIKMIRSPWNWTLRTKSLPT